MKWPTSLEGEGYSFKPVPAPVGIPENKSDLIKEHLSRDDYEFIGTKTNWAFFGMGINNRIVRICSSL